MAKHIYFKHRGDLKLYQILNILQYLNITYTEYNINPNKYVKKYNRLLDLEKDYPEAFSHIVKENLQLTASY